MLMSTFESLKSFGVELGGMIKVKKKSESANNILITKTVVIKCLSKLVVLQV